MAEQFILIFYTVEATEKLNRAVSYSSISHFPIFLKDCNWLHCNVKIRKLLSTDPIHKVLFHHGHHCTALLEYMWFKTFQTDAQVYTKKTERGESVLISVHA